MPPIVPVSLKEWTSTNTHSIYLFPQFPDQGEKKKVMIHFVLPEVASIAILYFIKVTCFFRVFFIPITYCTRKYIYLHIFYYDLFLYFFRHWTSFCHLGKLTMKADELINILVFEKLTAGNILSKYVESSSFRSLCGEGVGIGDILFNFSSFCELPPPPTPHMPITGRSCNQESRELC